MRFADRLPVSWLCLAGLLGAVPFQILHARERLTPVHAQRYSMGTMFDIIAYHGSRAGAEQAVETAMAEIVRLDRVMSHFNPDSDLSRLVREAPRGFVRVEPSLFDVLRRSLEYSRLSDGAFDVTIAPLLAIWRSAAVEGRRPSAAEIASARRCVGFRKIELRPPDLVWLRSTCLELDLGAIGKGYAVDRALEILRSAGIRDALVNAGGSSIAAIGTPPGRAGWPVRLGQMGKGLTLLLRDASVSTSQQNTMGFDGGHGGDIISPDTGSPAPGRVAVSVIAPSATDADALSTTLLVLSRGEGVKVLSQVPDAAAVWTSPDGRLEATYRESRLRFMESP